jgi:hypothetical protein
MALKGTGDSGDTQKRHANALPLAGHQFRVTPVDKILGFHNRQSIERAMQMIWTKGRRAPFIALRAMAVDRARAKHRERARLVDKSQCAFLLIRDMIPAKTG